MLQRITSKCRFFKERKEKKLIDDVQIHRGHVILDLGCGTGELSAYLSELVRQDGRVVAELFYTGTFPCTCTASTILSFLLFIQNNKYNDLFLLVRLQQQRQQSIVL